jgi:peptide/nickel transport system substrate-binding protein
LSQKKRTILGLTRIQWIAIAAIIIVVGAAGSYYYITYMSQPSEEITIVWTRNTGMNTIDPAIFTMDDQYFPIVNCYERLYTLDGTPAEWKVVRTDLTTGDPEISADGLTWTFHLTEGVKFHDGSEMTAEDVVFSMDRFLTLGRGFSFLFTPIIDVGDTEAVDTYTVQFHLSREDSVFRSAFVKFYILNKDLVMANIESGDYGEYGDYGVEWLKSHDAGSGPYTIDEWDLMTGGTIVAFSDYRGGWEEDSIDVAIQNVIPEYPSMKAALLGGTTTFACYTMPDEYYDEFKANPNLGIKVVEGTTWNQYFINMHTQRAPLDDVHVRRAIAWAFDYETLVNDVLVGAPQEVGPVPSTMWGYNPNVLQYSQNLAKASEELAMSKYTTDELNARKLQILHLGGNAKHEGIATLLMEALEDIGITNVEFNPVPYSKEVELSSDPTTANDFMVFMNACKLPDPDAFCYMMYSSDSIEAGSYFACSWFTNTRLEELWELEHGTVDENSRKTYLWEAQQILTEESPSIYLATWPNNQAFHDYVTGYRYIPLAGEDMYIYPFRVEK